MTLRQPVFGTTDVIRAEHLDHVGALTDGERLQLSPSQTIIKFQIYERSDSSDLQLPAFVSIYIKKKSDAATSNNNPQKFPATEETSFKSTFTTSAKQKINQCYHIRLINCFLAR